MPTKLVYVTGLLLAITQGAAADCLMAIASTAPAPPPREAALKRHVSLIQALQGTSPHLVVIGDSIAQQWPQDEIAALAEGRPFFNLGVGGDRTEHVLWRLAQSKTDLSKVETYVLAIGTNNLTGRYPACAISAGINAITAVLKMRSPLARILVLNIPAIFRGGERFENVRQAVNSALNQESFRAIFTSGQLPCTEANCTNYKSDRIHLSAQAYSAISKEIKGKILRK